MDTKRDSQTFSTDTYIASDETIAKKYIAVEIIDAHGLESENTIFANIEKCINYVIFSTRNPRYRAYINFIINEIQEYCRTSVLYSPTAVTGNASICLLSMIPNLSDKFMEIYNLNEQTSKNNLKKKFKKVRKMFQDYNFYTYNNIYHCFEEYNTIVGKINDFIKSNDFLNKNVNITELKELDLSQEQQHKHSIIEDNKKCIINIKIAKQNIENERTQQYIELDKFIDELFGDDDDDNDDIENIFSHIIEPTHIRQMCLLQNQNYFCHHHLS